LSKSMLLDSQDLHIASSDLPLLIHGAEGKGASLFSVSLVADLYMQGASILFLCGYSMARDEFDKQTNSKDESILVESKDDIGSIHRQRAIFLGKDHEELLLEILASLPDVPEQIIFLKNYELFAESTFESIFNHNKLVLAGDLDACYYRTRILEKGWKTSIYFSKPNTGTGVVIPDLQKYSGYLVGRDKHGVVTLAA